MYFAPGKRRTYMRIFNRAVLEKKQADFLARQRVLPFPDFELVLTDFQVRVLVTPVLSLTGWTK